MPSSKEAWLRHSDELSDSELVTEGQPAGNNYQATAVAAEEEEEEAAIVAA